MRQSPSSSSSSSLLEYDVFLSFRGEDTRHGFISHLLGALYKKNINTFVDYQLRKGAKISPSLLTAIERSKISIVVFSQDYASSKWCLEELVKIHECREKYDQIVIPVFYGVNPSDVRKQTGTFEDAFAKHERVYGKNSEKLQRWRLALTEAANIAGWDSGVIRIEFVLVNKIAKDALKKLEYKFSIEHNRLVGVASQVNLIESYMLAPANGVRTLGIWGTGGIGKTTLAEAVFRKISYRFDGSCFLHNIREDSERSTFNLLRQKLFSVILEDDYVKWALIKNKLRHKKVFRRKKVFIVFDDVTSWQQVNFLIENLDYLGSQSRIIITSRDKLVLKGVSVDLIYEVKDLLHDEALKLFSMYAFKQIHPKVDFMELSKRVVTYTGGVPLALKVLGCFLYGRRKADWKSAIERLENGVNVEIHNVLAPSFDGLDNEEKRLFLDISCCFVGEEMRFGQPFLHVNDYSEFSLVTLLDRALVTVSNHKIEMHNVIQRMGREIVRQESITNPGKRSRLWDHSDIYHVLTNNTGTESIQRISLDMSKIRDINLHPHIFTNMPRLRFLKFYTSSNELKSKVHASQGLLFWKLRYFHWHAYPLDSLPSHIYPEKLVVLYMPYSKIERLWNADEYFKRLKYINVSHSNLTIVPDLSLAPSLESLILEGCTRLLEIPSSIQCLKKLVRLNLRGCKSLRSLPNHIHLKSLKILILSGCSRLKIFPEMSGNIVELYLGETVIEELPASIEDLSNLVILDLENCSRLISLPTGICKLKCLEDLNLTGCSKLDRLPDDLGILKALKRLKISETGIRELPSSIVHLTKLGTLVVERCQHQEPIGLILPPLSGLDVLTDLIASDCNIKQLPDSLGCLPSLKRLSLCRNNFESMPASIINLSKLVFLNISYCKRLKSLPTLPRDLQLIAHNCTSLEALSGFSVPFMHRPSYTLAIDIINCFKLHKKALSNLVNHALQKIQHIPTLLITELDEESDEVPSVLICYPGSEVPEWFTFRRTECFVIVEHLPQCWFSENLVGFAVCAVVAFRDHYDDDRGLILVCKWEFESGDHYCHVAKGYFDGWGNDKSGTHYVGSDHVFLGCDFVMYPENFGEHYYINEFSVRFYIEDCYGERMDCCEVKKCGIRLIYRHEFENSTLDTSSDEDYFCRQLEEINESFSGDSEKETLHGRHQRSCKPALRPELVFDTNNPKIVSHIRSEMEKNINTNSSENVSRSTRCKVIWDSQSIEIFCDLYIKEVDLGHLLGTHLNKMGWDSLIKNFTEITGKKYSKVQMKNRWDTLKSDWKLWKELVGKETGLGWNARLKTINASEEWWHSKLQVFPSAQKFRKEGISLTILEKLDKMFMNTIAIEEHAWAPSAGTLPLDSSNIAPIPVENTTDSNESIPFTEDIEDVEKSRNRMLGVRDKKGKQVVGGGKVKTSAKLLDHVDTMIEAIHARNVARSEVKVESGLSIIEALQKLEVETELTPSNELWLFASILFLSKDERDVFSMINKPKDMLSWLRFKKEHSHRS